MARIRTIKPEFFTSLTIDKLPLVTRLTFIGLWTYADDHGRGMDDCRLIKAAVWPLRDSHAVKKVEQDMDTLAGHGLIVRYEVGGVRYFQILGWAEHQRVNRPSTSRIPQAPLPDASLKPPGTDTEDSLGERNGTREGKGMEENHVSLTETSNPNGNYKPCADCGFTFLQDLGRCPACAVRARA